MTAVRHGSLAFPEQIKMFRQKVSIGTDAWTDVYAGEHDIAFTVAGAKGQVLDDLHKQIDKVASEGMTIAEFRQNFRDIVQRTGWAYNGGENWRTRVIYETNLRQSYHAGREAQMADPELRKLRPYGLYRHGGSADPREEHLALDGTVVALDDPWWDTWSPMNGWGCNCKKFMISKADADRMGLKILEKAPPFEYEEKTIGVRGPSPRTVRVPKGIDPGFEHRPGANRIGEASERYMASLSGMDPRIAAATLSSNPLREGALEGLVQRQREWLDNLQARGTARNDVIHVGVINLPVLRRLADRGRLPESAGIVLRDQEALHILRDSKAAAGKALSRDQLDQLPRILAKPAAVLWDKQDGALLYVFPAPTGTGKLVVRIDYVEKIHDASGKRRKVRTNSIRTGGIVKVENLREGRYDLLEGEL